MTDSPLLDTSDHVSLKNDLRKLGKDILAPGEFHDKLAPAVMAYSDFLFNLTGIDPVSSEGKDHIELENGRAIGTFWAAFCIRQVIRTQRFCRGLHKAINHVLASKPLRPVHVVYAGTGPFATLALPVMLQFEPHEVQFTLLEINPESLAKLQSVIKVINIESYIKAVELCDATQWKSPNQEVDIVISETMERALQREPQVSIMLNMVSQLPNNVIYIPQEISVGVAYKSKMEDQIEHQSTLYSFNKTTYQKIISQSAGKNGWVYDVTNYNYSPVADKDLVYTTDIQIYEDEILRYPNCSLNFFQKVKPVLPAQNAQIRFQYQDSEMPGFEWTMD